MNQLQMLKIALIGYVNSMKSVWSALAYPLSIISKRKDNLKDYRIYGNTMQNGEPSPDNPIEVQSVGELTTKNLLDSDLWLPYFDKLEDGSYKSKQYISTAERVAINLPAGQYTLSVDVKCPSGNNYRPCFYYADGTRTTAGFISSNGEWLHHKYTVTFNNDVTSVGWYYSASSDQLYFRNFQIEVVDPDNKYKIGVVARGKNLFDVASYPLTKGRVIWSGSGGLSDEGQVNFAATVDYIPCVELRGKVITVNHTGGSSVGIAFYDANKTFISGVGYGNAKSKTVTVPDSASYYRFSVDVIYVDEIQVEYGAEATEFEPYKEPQSYHIYLDEPLRKIGEYEDYIDFEKGVVVRNTAKRVFDGTESWNYEPLSSGNNFYVKVADATYLGDTINVLCNMGVFLWGGSLTLNYSCKISLSLNFNFRYQEFSDLQSFKDKLKEFSDEGNPLCINYVLKSSTEKPITLPKLPQFKGTTVYEVDTEIKPSGIKVCYYE